MILESKEGIDILFSAQIEATSIGSALFVTSRDSAEFRIPGVTLSVARLEFFVCNWVGVLSHFVVQFSDTVSKELMACDVNLVTSEVIIGNFFGLFRSSKLDCTDRVTWHGVVEIDVLEANRFSDVIIVGNVDTKRAAVAGISDDL